MNVFFSGQPLPNSPYGVRVAPVSDARKVRATGRGVQPNGVRVKDLADFRIHTEGAGEGRPEVTIIGPGGVRRPVELKQLDGSTYEAKYQPSKEGRHVVMVTFAGQEIYKSPFEVNVGPYKETNIRAYGPGLDGGVVGHPATFTIETNGETGALGFSIEGPSEAKIECHDNGDGSADVSYYPTAPGDYAVHILCDNEDIPGSPYVARIKPAQGELRPNLVKVFGPGVQSANKNQPVSFSVDATRAGSAPVAVQVLDPTGRPIDVHAGEQDHISKYTYTPSQSGKHTILVNHGGIATPGSPYRVQVNEPLDPSKVQCFGPGLQSGKVKANQSTHFNVDCRYAEITKEKETTIKIGPCREAGLADLGISLKNEEARTEVPVKVTDNGDGTFTGEYETPQPGRHSLTASYGGEQVPSTPIKFDVEPNVDVSKIIVDGLEPSKLLPNRGEISYRTNGPVCTHSIRMYSEPFISAFSSQKRCK